MIKRFFLFTILSLCIVTLQAQINLFINAKVDNIPVLGDTIKVCKDKAIQFDAYGVYTPGVDLIEADSSSFYWYFGDQSSNTGKANDTIQKSYKNGGGYYLIVCVRDTDQIEACARKYIQVSTDPDFEDTKTLPDSIICPGSSFILDGNVKPKEWLYNLPDTIAYDEPKVIDELRFYSGFLQQGVFPLDMQIDSVEMIQSICISMEHSNQKDVELKLTCPSGESIILKEKNAGNDNVFMGTPIDNDLGDVGTAMNYCFSPDPVLGTMTSVSNTSSTLPEGIYTASESFTNLIGCRVVGNWTLEANDNTLTDNGFIFGWSIIFHPDMIPEPKWKFQNSYIKDSCYWYGDSVEIFQVRSQNGSQVNVSSSTLPLDSVNMYNYTFSVKDNFGCRQNEVIIAEVTAANFEVPEGGDAPVDALFEDLTHWAATTTWDFGDMQTGDGDTITHTYTEKGDYKITMTSTDINGCMDTDTATITITFPSSEFDVYNVFTPNGDNVNDLFIVKAKQGADKKLSDLMRYFECYIYNNMGHRVHVIKSAEEAENGWDGNVRENGGKASPGIYYCIIKAKGKDGREYKEAMFFHIFY